jgi:putative ABC transport system permease protein
MQTLWQDLRYGMRILIRNPGFTLFAISTLALGIGASAAMFSFFDAVLIKPMRYQAPEQLVIVWEQWSNGRKTTPDIATFQEWRRQNQVFSQLTAIRSMALNLTGHGAAERINSLFVSANYFDLIGAKPALGRFFSQDEDNPGRERVAVLTTRCWQQRFGGDPKILGADISLDNERYTVIGVAEPHKILDRSSTDLWLPLVFPSQNSQPIFFTAEARLKPGVTIEQADAEIKRITKGLAQNGLIHKNASALVQPLRDYIIGNYQQIVMLLMGAVTFMLLIACANVANLLLSRAMARKHEVAVRGALGAGRSRIMRQFLTESVLLAIVSSSMGVILAFWLIKGSKALMPPLMMPIETEATFDWRVLLFALGASLLTGISFGMAPAWQASRLDLTKSLQERGYGASARLLRNKLRSLLLVSEIALSFTLVIGAALLIRSFVRVLQADPGFQTERILTFQTFLDKNHYPQAHQLINYQTTFLDQLRALQGTQSVAVTSALPLSDNSFFNGISITGQSPGENPVRDTAAIRIVSSGYFETLGTRLLSGRYLSAHDTAQTSPVVVINQSLAKRHWPDRDPIGGQIQVAGSLFASRQFTIVGVVADQKHKGLLQQPAPEVYVLFSQLPEKALSSLAGRILNFAVRTTTTPSALTSTIRSLAAGIDKDQPLYSVSTMEELYSKSIAVPRFRTMIFSLFGTLALALGGLGVYGVMTYSVNQRTQEIGIRIALGASSGDVLRLVMWQGLVLTSAGIGIGLGAAIALTRFLTAYLYEVKATDVLTYIVVASILSSVALLASYLAARRAVKVDPIIVLRHE